MHTCGRAYTEKPLHINLGSISTFTTSSALCFFLLAHKHNTMSIHGNECSADFYRKGKHYWYQVEANINGMLGGLTNTNLIDVDDSRDTLKKILKQAVYTITTNTTDTDSPRLLRVLDCGAGIGRVSKYVLSQFFDQIDLLEQNEKFLQTCKTYLGESTYSKVVHTFAQGIQEFQPLDGVKYDCIWGQWVFGHITDQDLICFLKKCVNILQKPHGFVVIKDNVSSLEQCQIDHEDSSVTRSDSAYREVFQQVDGLQLKYTSRLKKMPKGLLPVRTYVLELTP